MERQSYSLIENGRAELERIMKSTNELLEEILSGDPQMVWSSSCAIMKLSQDDERIKEFLPYLDEIKAKTADLDMGGALVPNDRFVKKVIKILEHYKTDSGCSCCLLDGNDNPNYYQTIDIKEEVKLKDSNWVEYYLVECKKCNQKYKVYEREYHFTWWDWQSMS